MGSPDHPRVLVLGYGNTGREDDGLGPAAAAQIQQLGWRNVTVLDNYQLVIEDSADVAAADVVWFVDASKTCPEPYVVKSLSPSLYAEFTTHVVQPEVILALAQMYYGKSPQAYLMGIRGYQFEFREGLTARAAQNLVSAAAALTKMIASTQGTSQ